MAGRDRGKAQVRHVDFDAYRRRDSGAGAGSCQSEAGKDPATTDASSPLKG